jgi:hypothetical protein
MAWMSDEQYELMQDTRDKKITARSARKTRSHCGKSGSVKFPSDYLTKKERDAMNGEVKSYRMNDPMTWEEFKELPDDLKVCYIKAIRQKYNAPDSAIAEMFGASKSMLCTMLKKLGCCTGQRLGKGSRAWDEDGFMHWRTGGAVVETETETESDTEIKTEAETKTEPVVEVNPVTLKPVNDHWDLVASKTIERQTISIAPMTGELHFEGQIDDILRSVHTLLDGKDVQLVVKWAVVNTVEENDISDRKKRLKACATTASYALLNEERRRATGSKG